jgi:hypothetical protein
MTQERGQTGEIRVEAPLEPDFFFKNQAGMVTPEADKSPDTPSQHKAIYQTRGVGM